MLIVSRFVSISEGLNCWGSVDGEEVQLRIKERESFPRGFFRKGWSKVDSR